MHTYWRTKEHEEVVEKVILIRGLDGFNYFNCRLSYHEYYFIPAIGTPDSR